MAKINKYGIPSLRRDFPTDEACLEYIFNTLHSHKCSCGGNYSLIKGRKQYQCSKCRFQIAPTAGTIFHKSATPLNLWFQAILVFSNAKSGISAKQLERELEVTYKCAWRILSQIRKALVQDDKKLKGEVETDAGFIGGRGNAGKDNERLGEVMLKKSVVMVAVERGGKMRAKIVDKVTAINTHDFVRENVETGSTLFTDGSRSYEKLGGEYNHKSVNHKRKYVNGRTHVNNVETFFSHIKRSIKGTHKVISKKHLQTYLDGFVFHYNNRHNDRQRFASLLGTLLHA